MKVYERQGLPDRRDVIRATSNRNEGNSAYPMYGIEPLNDPYRFHPLPLEKSYFDPAWSKLKELPT